MTNLVANPAFAKLQVSLELKLKKKLAASGDEFLPGSAYLSRWGYRADNSGNLPH